MAEMFLLAPQWQGACILPEPEGAVHCYDESKVKWLNVFMAAGRGEISLCTCGSAWMHWWGLTLRVCWDQNESVGVCVHRRTALYLCTYNE